jgi:hypothetical protein
VEEDVMAEKDADAPYYRIMVGQDGLLVAVCLQWFDEPNYDQSRFVSEKHYEREVEACDFSVRKPIKTIDVRHWKQFQYLVGGDRDAIPPYFRCYVAHNFDPYVGNSILDNTHPLALLRDPCTREHPNGITINVFLCGVCANKLAKGKPEHLILDGDKLVDPATVKAKKAKHCWVMRH